MGGIKMKYINWLAKGSWGKDLTVLNCINYGYNTESLMKSINAQTLTNTELCGILLNTKYRQKNGISVFARFEDYAKLNLNKNKDRYSECGGYLFHVEGDNDTNWKQAFSTIDNIERGAGLRKPVYVYMGIGGVRDGTRALIEGSKNWKYVVGCYGGSYESTVEHAKKVAKSIIAKTGDIFIPCVGEDSAESIHKWKDKDNLWYGYDHYDTVITLFKTGGWAAAYDADVKPYVKSRVDAAHNHVPRCTMG